MPKRIVIFASGSGSNAENIISFFREDKNVEVSLILTNNKSAGVIDRAERLGVECHIFDRDTLLNKTNLLIDKLKKVKTDLIVLAGFLLKIPKGLIEAFPNEIINIHPSLLPKYGGGGMYGMKVHESVIHAREKKSGITIHYINEYFDQGDILFQGETEIEESDTAYTLSEKIHELEHLYLPLIIKSLISRL
ncbi:phosphoribosylglycinamide formyltransferase [Ichthyobacterium seriolicida]|uniref:Phosphoribosylglycinamide formyltransferase n=1 Tax=Ichthyobacterium seriolicida TaxID=242600 RepID=A0A1J1DXB6_9FLAO|nr:phosphoribosylglycinamide formyltransferase [Ichthyobacterium seriolicida]BAV94498.1 phosphoribosylglycinamide formyltransferase [Ichthyobacterium seriolicida]